MTVVSAHAVRLWLLATGQRNRELEPILAGG
jgi:hypothetical protein